MATVEPGVNWDMHDHAGLVPYMVECLQNDGYQQLAAFIRGSAREGGSFEERLMDGARDADMPISPYWVNIIAHFHDPCTHCGLEGIAYSAADAAVSVRRDALAEWKGGNYGKACIHVGRCLHLIGDAGGIPHHAAGLGYVVEDPSGHRDYENWLKEDAHWKQYAVTSGGYYAHWQSYHTCRNGVHLTRSGRAYDWIDQASVAARRLMPAVDKHTDGFRERFPSVARVLVPSVIRWGAGFIQDFFSDPEVVAAWPK